MWLTALLATATAADIALGDDWSVELEAALGASALVYVGNESDLARFDLALTETVVVGPAMLEGELAGPAGVYAVARVEEGKVHAAELELAEARLGWWYGEVVDVWVGRGDMGVTRDREMEVEELALSTRPTLSRTLLPLHLSGAGLGLSWPDRATLRAGASFTSNVSDAPWLWTRLTVHPLGALPEDQAAEGGWRVQVGGGYAHLPSPALGQQWMATMDVELHGGPVLLGAGWMRARTSRERSAFSVLTGTRIGVSEAVTAGLFFRGERVLDLVAGEDHRWVGALRASAFVLKDQLELFSEVALSRESGSGVGDVVVLTIERPNDVVAAGVRARW